MNRVARLSAAAERVQADLRRTTSRPWTCSADGDYTLTVIDGVVDERLLLEVEVEDEDWSWRLAPPPRSRVPASTRTPTSCSRPRLPKR